MLAMVAPPYGRTGAGTDGAGPRSNASLSIHAGGEPAFPGGACPPGRGWLCPCSAWIAFLIFPVKILWRSSSRASIRAFQQACEQKGLFYPPDPASGKATSVGGNVMTCAGGLRAVKYGVTRDYVLGMEVVLPGGKLLKLGGRTHKDVIGWISPVCSWAARARSASSPNCI